MKTNTSADQKSSLSNNVLCFGDCNIDILVLIEKLPELGGCSWSDKYKIDIGGTMINTLVALNRLGVDAYPVTKVGGDYNGSLIKEYLSKLDINIDRVFTDNYQTGMVIGLVEPCGEKRWIGATVNAANNHVKFDEISLKDVPKYLFLAGSELSKGVESKNAAFELAKTVSTAGGTVFLDPNLRITNSELSAEVRETFNKMMPNIDYLLANKNETLLLGNSSNLDDAARNLLKQGAKNVWVKKGGAGSIFYSNNLAADFEPYPVEVRDTSGAGDAFNAAVVYSIFNGYDIDTTGKFANIFAAYTVGRLGTSSSLPPQKEIKKMLQLCKNAGVISK